MKKSGWKPGDTLLYQQEYSLTPEQQKVFEGKKSIKPEIVKLRKKIEENKEYEPSTDEIETTKDWAKKPKVYLDEGQLQKVYDFKHGSIWDFFLHAL